MDNKTKKTLEMCNQFLNNDTRNPKTNRKIKKNGPTYKKLMKECSNIIKVEKKKKQKKPRVVLALPGLKKLRKPVVAPLPPGLRKSPLTPKQPSKPAPPGLKKIVKKTGRKQKKPRKIVKSIPKVIKPVMRVQRIRRTEPDPVCDIWLRFKDKNPKTGRKIKVNGPTYKKFVKQCITNKEIRKNLTLIDSSVRKIVTDYGKKSVNLIVKKRTRGIRDQNVRLISGTKLTELIMILYLLRKHKKGINMLLRKDFKKLFKKINTNKMNLKDIRSLDYLTIVNIDPKTDKPTDVFFPYTNKGMDMYFWASNNPKDKQSKNRFTFLLMSIQSKGIKGSDGKYIKNKEPWGHFNFMVYDKNENTIYRFEPNGGSVNFYDSPALDKMLTERFKKWGDIQYKSMNNFCPIIPGKRGTRGPQALEDRTEIQLTDPGGFCAYWSIFFIDFILTNYKKKAFKNYTIEDYLKSMIADIGSKFGTYKQFIRTFAIFINNAAKNIHNKDIDKYIDGMIDQI